MVLKDIDIKIILFNRRNREREKGEIGGERREREGEIEKERGKNFVEI